MAIDRSLSDCSGTMYTLLENPAKITGVLDISSCIWEKICRGVKAVVNGESLALVCESDLEAVLVDAVCWLHGVVVWFLVFGPFLCLC